MTTLRFKKPEIKASRLKVMFYGEMGTGKSICACSFPQTAYIDTEGTTSKVKYAQTIIDNQGQVIETGDFEEILTMVKWLMTNKHDFKTLVIDSLTVPYENLIIEMERKVGSEFGRHVTAANSKMKQLVNLLLRIDMNVIITCQAKKEYGGKMEVIGQTYNCYNRLGYMFDLVFEAQIRGDNHIGVVRKSRIDSFPMRDKFDFNYEEIRKRYGSEIMEKAVVSETLATKEQVIELNRLIELFAITEETSQKWLDKCNCDGFEDMPSEVIQKCIDSLHKKLQGVAA